MRIGVLAERVGLTAKTIRFYEEVGLVPSPPRTSGGYRDYPEEAITRLRFVHDAQAAGLSLADIRQILAVRDSGAAPCGHVTQLIEVHLAQVEQRLAELAQAQVVLQQLRERAAATDPATCAGPEVCTILATPPVVR
ncbi:heavy metal-responsive transcriptional regulator [Actinomadura sp. NPDC048394]|uniref:heavy metal-responsive transcriptional regulator n=1 Tax=Actinomadura sp. NPDC048394 TaxID=3158223 RepID=UPI0033D68049